MSKRGVISARAERRLGAAVAWLAERRPGDEVLVVGASYEAAAETIRGAGQVRGSGFGWHRLGFAGLAVELAKLELAMRDLAPAGALAMEAVCARVIHRLGGDGRLGRLSALAQQPGLPRALARTLGELRMAGVWRGVPALSPVLAAALEALDDELAAAHLVDRAAIYRIAGEALARHPWRGHAVLLVDVPLRAAIERELVTALAAHAPELLATVPAGDERTARELVAIVGELETLRDEPVGSLARVQEHLFAPGSEDAPARAELDDSLAIVSAPGESRECVEIARGVMREAARGVPFDRMAVLLRSPEQYRVHLEEALARADIPAHFEKGTVVPDPSGRAFLALLACAAEDLSARRFAEYASLGEVPAEASGAPPVAAPAADRWRMPDDDLFAELDDAEAEPEITESGSLRAPRRWERLLVDAAVMGGRARWERRLDGLDKQLEREVSEDDDEVVRTARARRREDLASLRAFALPLLDDLERLPPMARWRDWLDTLTALATRALRRPERVLAALASLAPMGDVGPVDLREVRLVLAPRLAELHVAPAAARYGRVLVAPIDAARGRTFDVVFVPGLAERMFPQKLAEDPLLLDADRLATGVDLATRADRLADERLALRLALGAARTRAVLSYPRIDADQGRPRVPSFYGLEVLEAAEGALPGFDELGRRADVTGAPRIGWPAPSERMEAIDEAEHDLALLDTLVRPNHHAPIGAAAYLVHANPHLARALRHRARRWEIKAWKPADGLIVSTDEARAALAPHAPDQRSFSPTALEKLASCPYRFALYTIVKLAPREEPAPIEVLGPLERGSLVHEVQFVLLSELRDAGELPVRAEHVDRVRDRLDLVLERVAARVRDDLAPAIDRVWDDGIASIRADLREWLRRLADDVQWAPRRFELAFGLGAAKEERDAASVADPVPIDAGIKLRGSIDLVEVKSDGTLRATDYKTGKARVSAGAVIAGGSSLQPVMYALALEKLVPDAHVSGGSLYYCTTKGDFQRVDVPLDQMARDAARVVAETLAFHASEGFYPAAPGDKECEYCDYRPICGPHEEERAKKKDPQRLAHLVKLRKTP